MTYYSKHDKKRAVYNIISKIINDYGKDDYKVPFHFYNNFKSVVEELWIYIRHHEKNLIVAIIISKLLTDSNEFLGKIMIEAIYHRLKVDMGYANLCLREAFDKINEENKEANQEPHNKLQNQY